MWHIFVWNTRAPPWKNHCSIIFHQNHLSYQSTTRPEQHRLWFVFFPSVVSFVQLCTREPKRLINSLFARFHMKAKDRNSGWPQKKYTVKGFHAFVLNQLKKEWTFLEKCTFCVNSWIGQQNRFNGAFAQRFATLLMMLYSLEDHCLNVLLDWWIICWNKTVQLRSCI